MRGIGPSLSSQNVSGALQNPTLELHDRNGMLIAENDDWMYDQKAAIEATDLPPTNSLESAIVATLPSGACTAVLRGKNDTTGVGLVEVYNLK
ncbi:MAG: hypothetical protein M3Q46_03125 [Verrucomicrobiota bacterium]|nr:hypothetical protein [Verrucomicrobiota bacterium]